MDIYPNYRALITFKCYDIVNCFSKNFLCDSFSFLHTPNTETKSIFSAERSINHFSKHRNTFAFSPSVQHMFKKSRPNSGTTKTHSHQMLLSLTLVCAICVACTTLISRNSNEKKLIETIHIHGQTVRKGPCVSICANTLYDSFVALVNSFVMFDTISLESLFDSLHFSSYSDVSCIGAE